MSIFRQANDYPVDEPTAEALAATLQESAAEKQNAIKEAIVRHGATVAYVTEAADTRLRQIYAELTALEAEREGLLKVHQLAAGTPDPLEA
jgi:hypothetical protein